MAEKGGLPLSQRLNARVLDILEKHQPKPLDAEKSQKLRQILASAKSEAQGLFNLGINLKKLQGILFVSAVSHDYIF
ncbi:MAG: hypothetical protein M5U05_10085 [Anaerolineales bacterium]|nr:hypothetical protein [Anaerolineales bacterium]